MAVRCGGKALGSVGRNGESKVGKGEHNAAHDLTVCTVVPLVKFKAAL